MSEFSLLTTTLARGLNVIEASAGTGKTWTLAHLVPRLILEGRIDALDQAVLVSFTDEATRELSERVRRAIHETAQLLPDPAAFSQLAAQDSLLEEAIAAAKKAGQPGPEALLGVLKAQTPELRLPRLLALLKARLDADRLGVSTIHAFCRKVLADEAFLCGVPSGLGVAQDTSEARAQALRDAWREDLVGNSLLASVAALQGWELDDDERAWRQLEPTGSLRLHPAPPILAESLSKLTAALQGMKSCIKDQATMAKLLDSSINLNKSGRAVAAGLEQALLQAESLSLNAGLVAWLGYVDDPEDWFSKAKGSGDRELALRTLLALPLFRQAQAAAAALAELPWAWRGQVLGSAQRRLDQRLRADDQLSYNDLISRLAQALQGSHGPELAARLRLRWRVALVDESQDTDSRQLGIFQAIFCGPQALDRSLVLIGDPKQSIYSFRSADLTAYLGARNDTAPAALQQLTTTHRSAPGLVAALNAIFHREHSLASPDLQVPLARAARTDQALALPRGLSHRLEAAFLDFEALAHWRRARDMERLSAKAAAVAISKLLGREMDNGVGGSDTVGPSHCAVLVRSNRQAKEVREALKALGIHSVIKDDGDVLASDAAKDLHTLLKAVVQPRRRDLRLAALATRLLGHDAAALAALDPAGEEALHLDLLALNHTWASQGIAALLASLEERRGVSSRLAISGQGERLLTDLRHLTELLQGEEASRRLAPERLLRWLEAGMAEAGATGAAEGRLQRLDADAESVQVLTIHRAKGLEFDFVACPYLWDAKAPKESGVQVLRLEDGQRALVDLDRAKADKRALLERAKVEVLQEELRLAYVALTRAKRYAWFLAGWVGYSDGNSSKGPSALDWLFREPEVGLEPLAWHGDMTLRKRIPRGAPLSDLPRGAATCPHEAALKALQAACPMIAVSKVDLLGGTPRSVEAAQGQGLAAEPAPSVPGAWSITSFTRFTRGGDEAHSSQIWRAAALSSEERLPLAQLRGSAAVGVCLHELMEHWTCSPDELGPIEAVLQRHGMMKDLAPGQPLAGVLRKLMPGWSKSDLPGLGSLAKCASEPALSEWHFVLPLAEAGLSGLDLAQAFQSHSRSELRAYGATLASLGSQAVQGMLQGYIDRLVRHDGAWGVVDWKSNALGACANDFSEAGMFEVAARHHYILQLHLYLLALRRHLRLHAPGQRLHSASLVFLRALEAGTSKGILTFEAEAGVLDALEARFMVGVGR